MLRNLLTVINSNNKKKPYSIKANQIGVTRNAVAINPLTGYNVSTANVMTQVNNSSVSNLVVNGGFETDSNSDGWADGFATYYSTGSLDTTKYYNGSKSQKCVSTSNGYFGTNTGYFSFLANHKYYLAYMNYIPSVNTGKTNNIYIDATSFSANYNNGLDVWQKQSCIFSYNTDISKTMYFRVASSVVGDVVYFDNVVMIDLTATFGKGFEPTRDWCDANIPFFTGTLSNPPWVNPLVTHNQYAYVGGDTTELTFDFGTKVAGSVVECPMRIFYQYVNLASISNPSTGWTLIDSGNQSTLDLLKTQEGNSWVGTCSVNGLSLAYLIELDLSAVANQYYGGSISALKSALKISNIDVWAKGSGSNSGVDTNGCRLQVWNNLWATSGWVSIYSPGYTGPDWYTLNTTGSITKMSQDPGSLSASNRNDIINANGKLYIMVNSMYASNGTILSSVTLDYLRVTIGLNRTVDVATPKDIYLPPYWAMFIKGLSTNWDSADGKNRKFLHIKNASSNNHFQFYKLSSTISFYKDNGTGVNLGSSAQTFSKNQTYNALIAQTPKGMKMSLLKNNGTVEHYSNSDSSVLGGNYKIYPLSLASSGYESDSFVESLQLYDLTKLGKIKLGSELVNNGDFSNGGTGWTLNSNASVINGQLVLNATGNYQDSTQWLYNIIPNQNYKFSASIPNVNATVRIGYYDNSGVFISWGPTLTSTSGSSFTTPSNCYRIYVVISNNTYTGTFIFDDISVKQILNDGFNDYEVEAILRGDNKYYQSVTSDFTGKVPGSVVENPNIFSRSFNNSIYGHTALVTPYLSSSYKLEGGPLTYTNISSQNGTCIDATVTTAGYLPQHIMSYNIIEITERKYGPIPTVNGTKAEKIAWLINNICKISCNWVGYGSSPVGAKALFRHWNCQTATWEGSSQNNTSSPSQIAYSITANINSFIDSDGYMHFLAYTDSARTTDNNYLYLTNHGLINYDVIENVTRGGALAVLTYPLTNSFTTWTVTGQTAGDTIKKYHYSSNKTAETGTNDTTIKITAHGLSTGDVIKNSSRGSVVKKVTVADANTLTLSSAITGQTVGDIIAVLPYTGTQTAENGVASSVIYTDHASLLDVSVKTGKSSVYVPQKEMFDIDAVTLNLYATRNNGVVTLNATGSYQESYINIPVLPNNKYELTGNLTGANGYIVPREYYNSNIIRTNAGLTTSGTTTFTTGPNTNSIRILLGSSTSGTFTFSNISLKLKM